MSPGRFAVRLREERALTQAALAKRPASVAPTSARLEMGRHDPHLSRLRKLAKALKVKVGDLVD